MKFNQDYKREQEIWLRALSKTNAAAATLYAEDGDITKETIKQLLKDAEIKQYGNIENQTKLDFWTQEFPERLFRTNNEAKIQ